MLKHVEILKLCLRFLWHIVLCRYIKCGGDAEFLCFADCASQYNLSN